MSTSITSTKRQISGLSVHKGLLKWMVSVPDDRPVTPIDRVITFISRFCMLFIVVVVVITFYEVIMRYVFRSPTLWVNEMTLWLGSATFLVSGMYTMQRRGHIRITAVYDIMPRKLQLACEVLAVIVIVSYVGLFVIPSAPNVWETFISWERFGTFWNPPIPATVKPLCLIVTTLIGVQAVNNLFVDWKNPHPISPEQETVEEMVD